MSDPKLANLARDPTVPAFRRKLWMHARTPDGPRLIIFWPRIFKLLAVLLITGWLVLAGALWAFVKYQRGITEVRFADVAFYPVRRAPYRATLGRHHLATGKLQFEKHNWSEGLLSLRAAMAYAPGNLEIRLILAEFYQHVKRPELALQTMEGGAPYALGDVTYFQKLFNLYEIQGEPARAVGQAEQLLPGRPDDQAVHRFIAHQAAKACLQLQRLADAEEFIQRWRLDLTPEGQILLAGISAARDQPGEAVQRLELLLQRDPRSEQIALQLTRLYLNLGHLEAARRTALLRSIARPESPGGRIDLLNIDWQLGNKDDFAHNAELFLEDFTDDPLALNLLAQVAADLAQPNLARQVLDAANEAAHPPAAFLFALMQAQCGAQQYEAALTTAGEIDRKPGITERAGASLLALKCWACFGVQNEPEGEAWLHRFLSADYSTGDALRLARALENIGALKPAARVFTAASDRGGDTGAAAIAAAEFHVRHNAWTEAGALLPRLKKLPLPPAELIENVESNLAFRGPGPR